MPYVIGAAAAIFVVALTLRVAYRRPPQLMPIDPPATQSFKVTVVGARGSGKTMLLASMYKIMQTHADRNYYLSAPRHQVRALNQMMLDVARPSGDFPRGNTGIREFQFAVKHKNVDRPVLEIEYIDYAGGMLTDEHDSGAEGPGLLDERIRSSDALIGVLDGQRIEQHLNGDPEGAAYLQETYTNLVSLAYETSVPVSFVITKWDVLYNGEGDENERLGEVRDLLMKSAEFADLVQANNGRRIARLVPTSAIGANFYKSRGSESIVRPCNVDVPIASVVPDILDQAAAQFSEADHDRVAQIIRKQIDVGPGGAARELAEFFAEKFGKGSRLIFPDKVAAILELAVGMDSIKERRLRREIEIDRLINYGVRDVDLSRSVRREVIQEMRSRVAKLEARLPNSRF